MVGSILPGTVKSVNSSSTTAFGMQMGELWKSSKEQMAFSLETVLLPSVVTGNFRVLSHQTVFDGIWMDADNINFSVIFNGGTVTCSWPTPDFMKRYHVVGTYTPGRIQLWIDGVMVSETTVPEGYPESKFNHGVDAYVYTGTGATAGNKVTIDAMSSYGYALSEDQVQKHYIASRDVVLMDNNVGFYGGAYRDGTQRNTFQQQVYNDETSWTSDSMNMVSVQDGTLRPVESQDVATLGQSMAGTWIGTFNIDTSEIPTIGGIKAEWDGDGNYTVQTSLDGGTSYQTVTNGELVPASQGINPSGVSLLVKITFTGGVVGDISAVRSLTLTAYVDNSILGDDTSRPLTISGNVSTSLNRWEPIDFHQRAGIHFNGGFLTLGPDTQEVPVPTLALEFWIRPRGVTSGTGAYVFDTRPGGGTAFMWLPEASTTWAWAGAGSVYINGVLSTTGVTAVKNEWTHIVFNLAASNNTNINIGAGQLVGEMNLVATYPSTLTTQQAQALYANYTGVPLAAITEGGVPTIFEPATPYVLTLLDWATLPQ